MNDTEKALVKALREIILRWDGADDCTAAVNRAKVTLAKVEAGA